MDEKQREKNATNNVIPLTIKGRNGGRLKAGGTPGNKGGGRPSKAFLERWSAGADSDKFWDAVEKIACDPKNRNWAAAANLLLKYGKGGHEQLHTQDEEDDEERGYVIERPPELPPWKQESA